MIDSGIILEKNFHPKARAMRAHFDKVYKNPRFSHEKRFVWDHWNLDGQYRQHRAMARDFLPPKLYKALKDTLVQYGQNELGCHSISEPWISYYTEGDFQELHTDSPHGPWAYVFSLTEWKTREFTGGETQIMKPSILGDYWNHYSRHSGLETKNLFDLISPEFNQLLVFDPRRPHGVRRVSGVHNPSQGRLVVHGWFVHPEPFVLGPHDVKLVTGVLNKEIPRIFAPLKPDAWPSGILTYELGIKKNGAISSVKVKTNSLVTPNPRDTAKSVTAQIMKPLLNGLKKIRFHSARGSSKLILPIVLD